MKKLSVLYFTLLLALACQQSQPESFDTYSQVDPFIGTGGHGHTYPGATTPFGMVQLSPDNGTEGWDWCSGYHYSDSLLAGFSHTHLSGTGIGDWADISVMPLLEQDRSVNPSPRYRYEHANEQAKPGFYHLQLDNGIEAELTATPRVGIHRYQFPDGQASLSFDMGFSINWDDPVDSYLHLLNDTTLVGYRISTGWAKDQRVYFAARFSNPLTSYAAFTKDEALGGMDGDSLRAPEARFVIHWDNQDEILLRVGLSSASIEGAIASLQQEAPKNSFAEYRASAKALWNEGLSGISARFHEPAYDTIFATALYHTMLAPNLYEDANGTYKGVGGSIQQAEDFDRYTVFSLWDTFRAAHSLFLFTQPDRIDDFYRSMLAFYDESGALPVWALSGHETHTMTGYHAVPVLAEGILKGYIQDQQLIRKAYEAMKKSAMQDIRGTNFYREYEYIPHDKDGWSVTKTLEYAYDDWCIAQVAAILGEEEGEQYYLKRSQYYRNLFDPETGFMRAKDSDGNWVEPFDPYYSEHGFEGMYIEGTAWQHSWFVPHDVKGLADLFGGKQKLIKKLDETFETSSELRGENVSVDISGLIGQYAHGNEPSHHVAYLYTMLGEHHKTQQKIRQILTELYTTGPEGLSGNDDCGQMSAWYIFSALGFYPVDPVSGKYIIGSPLVERAEIKLSQNKTFEIRVENQADEHPYIQEIRLNGQNIANRMWISHEEILAGGKLEFVMTAKPNRD